MKQFNLKEYLANPNRRVVTGDGRNVRIIYTDGKRRNYPIIALVEEPSSRFENVFSYTEGGQLISYAPSKEHDLFFAPEKHEGWALFIKQIPSGHISLGAAIYGTKEEAQRVYETRPDCYSAIVKLEWEE